MYLQNVGYTPKYFFALYARTRVTLRYFLRLEGGDMLYPYCSWPVCALLLPRPDHA